MHSSKDDQIVGKSRRCASVATHVTRARVPQELEKLRGDTDAAKHKQLRDAIGKYQKAACALLPPYLPASALWLAWGCTTPSASTGKRPVRSCPPCLPASAL